MSEWRDISTAPVDGRIVTVREADGSWGKARVMGQRGAFETGRFKYVWVWAERRGKAYPTEWRAEPPHA